MSDYGAVELKQPVESPEWISAGETNILQTASGGAVCLAVTPPHQDQMPGPRKVLVQQARKRMLSRPPRELRIGCWSSRRCNNSANGLLR